MSLTLLTLASKQIWPQVLSVAHLKPARLFLIHSEDAAESKGPAERLRRLFDQTNLIPEQNTQLETISQSDFSSIERAFDRIQADNKLPLGECVLNFTGGNKLMATAAFRWAAKRGVRAFYLERTNEITWFEPRDGDLGTRTERARDDATNGLDPIALLACQFGEGEIKSDGEILHLSEKGGKAVFGDINASLRRDIALKRGGFDFRKWLEISGTPVAEQRDGDNLEYAVAVVVLKLGVPMVRRSVELRSTKWTDIAEGELDLIFNWNGRLWVVDCKDRTASETKVESLKTELLRENLSLSRVDKLLGPLVEDLKEKEIKILREDLLQISEVAGLLGSAIAVRSAEVPIQALEFANSRKPRVEIIRKHELEVKLRRLLERKSSSSRSV